jgi:hypothetical protein
VQGPLGHHRQVIDIDPKVAKDLPIDELGMAVLEDLLSTGERNEVNYLNSAKHHPAYGPAGEARYAIAEALGWLRTRSLFAGAYAVLRNPSGHRDVDYDDVAEAAEAVVSASLLMRVLDRVEKRLSA